MRSREFIKEASAKRIIIQKFNDAVEGLVYILKHPNGDTVRDPAGQTLTYPTRDAAADARNKMSDPAAIRGADDAKEREPSALRAGEAGKVGNSFEWAKVDPSTGQLTQKVTYQDANGKNQTIVKTYKDWVDFINRTGVYPFNSWRPGYAQAITKKLSGTTWWTLWFFSPGDLALIAGIIAEWVWVVSSIKEEYRKNIYSNKESGTAGVQSDIDQINKKYIAKLAKAIAVCLATNWGNNGVYLARAAISKVAPKVGQATLANAVSSLFKFTGKPISPALAKLLADGGAEYTKLLAAYIISDNELKSSPEDHWLVAPLIKAVVLLADITTDLGNSVLKALPIGKYIQINPADIDAMNKSATDNNQKPTKPPTPPSSKPGDEPSLSTDIRNTVNAAPD
jgi:hypothetical protein